jgi:hypothetical protein
LVYASLLVPSAVLRVPSAVLRVPSVVLRVPSVVLPASVVFFVLSMRRVVGVVEKHFFCSYEDFESPSC